MSHSGPFFHAWCPDDQRVAAYASALWSLLSRKWWKGPPTREELVESARQSAADQKSIRDSRSYQLLSEHVVNFDLEVWRDSYEYAGDGGPLVLQPEHQHDLLFLKMPIAREGKRSVEIESAIFTIVTVENTIELLKRLCVPGELCQVMTGACTWDLWESPLDACITFHADANVGRDLATAWLNGYEQSSAAQLAGLGLPELQTRIAAATAHQAQVAKVSMVGFVDILWETLSDLSTNRHNRRLR